MGGASDVIGADGDRGGATYPVIGLALLAIAYWVTRAPFVIPGDSAELVSASVTLGLAHPTGYPLYIVLGKLVSSLFFFASAATVLNLFSAACCLASLAALGLTLNKLQVSPVITAAVFLLLGLTQSIWNYATFAEVYSLHGFLLAVIMYLLVTFPGRPTAFRLCAVWAVAGASLGNHMTSILLIPGLAVWTLLVLRSMGLSRPRFAALSIVSSYAAGASVIGLLFFFDRSNVINYINQYAAEVADPRFSDPVSRFLWVVFAQQYQAVSGIAESLLSFGWLSGAIKVLQTAWIENPVLLVVGGVGLIGCLAGWKTRPGTGPFFVFVGVTAVVNILYFATYSRFFEPIFLIHFYFLLAVGMAHFLARAFRSARTRRLTAVVLGVIAMSQFASNFATIDKSGTEIYALETERFLENIEPDAVVFSTWESSTLIWYFQWVEGRHREVTVVNAMPHNWPRMAGRFGGRPLYFETIPPGQSEASFVPALHFYKFVSLPAN